MHFHTFQLIVLVLWLVTLLSSCYACWVNGINWGYWIQIVMAMYLMSLLARHAFCIVLRRMLHLLLWFVIAVIQLSNIISRCECHQQTLNSRPPYRSTELPGCVHWTYIGINFVYNIKQTFLFQEQWRHVSHIYSITQSAVYFLKIHFKRYCASCLVDGWMDFQSCSFYLPFDDESFLSFSLFPVV